MVTELILLGLGVLIGVIGYLLAKRDESRQAEIKANEDAVNKLRAEHQSEIHELFRLRNQDVMALAEYKLKVSENHYPKSELDMRFQQLNTTMERGFGQVNDGLKELTKALTDHISNH